MYFSHFILKHCFKQFFASEGESNFLFIRTTIFLIAGVCGGLPAVVWALHVLYHHHRSGGRISAISIFLLLSDLLELIFNSVILAFTLGRHYIENCNVVVVFLFGIMLCGHHLHQLVAQEYVFCLRYPSLAHIFSPLCSTELCIIVVLLVIVTMFLYYGWLINLCLSLLPLVVLAATCLLTCKASSDHVLPTHRKPCFLVLFCHVYVIFLYVPWLLMEVFNLPFGLDSLVSLRVISEPLLCVFVCRESFWVQKEQECSDQSGTP